MLPIRSLKPLEGVILWKRALETYYGIKTGKRDVNEGRRLAERAKLYPGPAREDAVWFCRLIDEKMKIPRPFSKKKRDEEDEDPEDRKRRLFHEGLDAAARYYDDPDAEKAFLASAEMGYAPAMSELVNRNWSKGPDVWGIWAEKAAIAGDAIGMGIIACEYWEVGKNKEQVKEFRRLHGITLERAALTGSLQACDVLYLRSRNEFWHFLEMRLNFAVDPYMRVRNMLAGVHNPNVIEGCVKYQLGLSLYELQVIDVNHEDDNWWNRIYEQNTELIDAYINYYKRCFSDARLAVRTWTLIASRLHVVRDIRRLIGEWIWAQRTEWFSPCISNGTQLVKRLKK